MNFIGNNQPEPVRRHSSKRSETMKTLTLTALAAVVVIALAGTAVAAEKTYTGQVACAKCTLKLPGATECQNVLVVKDDNGTTANYYVVMNAVAKKFGHVCKGMKPAVVTGTLSEKDGKTWITPTKMEEEK
jgi:Family of unknown function (DUF6370)